MTADRYTLMTLMTAQQNNHFVPRNILHHQMQQYHRSLSKVKIWAALILSYVVRSSLSLLLALLKLL